MTPAKEQPFRGRILGDILEPLGPAEDVLPLPPREFPTRRGRRHGGGLPLVGPQGQPLQNPLAVHLQESLPVATPTAGQGLLGPRLKGRSGVIPRRGILPPKLVGKDKVLHKVQHPAAPGLKGLQDFLHQVGVVLQVVGIAHQKAPEVLDLAMGVLGPCDEDAHPVAKAPDGHIEDLSLSGSIGKAAQCGGFGQDEFRGQKALGQGIQSPVDVALGTLGAFPVLLLAPGKSPRESP